MGREDEIRLIAYSIWEEEGHPDGKDYEHWLRAEATWEQQQKHNTALTSATTESKPGVTKKTKTVAARKKSPKT